MKECNHCHKNLSIAEYHHNYSMKDGLQKTCKSCSRVMRIKGMKGELARRKVKRDSDQKELNNAWWERKVHYYKWKLKSNTDYREVITIFNNQNKKCFYCNLELRTAEQIHLEHYYPKSDKKIVISCPDCNRLKWRKNGDEFIVFLKEYISRFR